MITSNKLSLIQALFSLYSLSKTSVLFIVCEHNNGLNTIPCIFSKLVPLAILFTNVIAFYTDSLSIERETQLSRRIYAMAFVCWCCCCCRCFKEKQKTFHCFVMYLHFWVNKSEKRFVKARINHQGNTFCNIFQTLFAFFLYFSIVYTFIIELVQLCYFLSASNGR